MSVRSEWRLVLVVLVTAAVIRGGALGLTPGALSEDVDGYRQLAENLHTAGVFGWRTSHGGPQAVRPTAFRPPLYPLLLACACNEDGLSFVWAAALHWAIGMATVGLILCVSRSYLSGRWSCAAAMLVACDPILLHQSTQVMTETLATLLAVMGLAGCTWLERRAAPGIVFLVGALQAIAALSRPTFLPWLILCVLALLVLPGIRGRRLTHVATWVSGAALILLPWAARNAFQFGHWKCTTTHGGYTLLLANNPSFYDSLRREPWRRVWTSEELASAWKRRGHAYDARDPLWSGLALGKRADLSPRTAGAGVSEFSDDRLAYALAARYIREQPVMFVASCGVRLGRFWSPIPQRLAPHESREVLLARWACALWYAVLFLLAMVGARQLRWRLLRPPWLWGFLLCLAFTAVHVVYWTDMRMRAPLMPYVGLLAAVGGAHITSSRRDRKLLVDRELQPDTPA